MLKQLVSTARRLAARFTRAGSELDGGTVQIVRRVTGTR
jgi:hypothetical protein